MDLQFYGASCVSVAYKGTRVMVDDNLAELGAKTVTKADDVALFTSNHDKSPAKMIIDGPGEYETADISIIGIPARAHMDEEGKKTATMFNVRAGDVSVLFAGHIYPELSEDQLEDIGLIDVLVVPVGGNGFTLDPVGAQKVVKAVEPKVVIPVHYADKGLAYPVPQQSLDDALKELGEPTERLGKFKVKSGELSEATRLIVLERS